MERPSAVERWASRRQLHVDNLTVILIAAIIAGHAVGSYTSMEVWARSSVAGGGDGTKVPREQE